MVYSYGVMLPPPDAFWWMYFSLPFLFSIVWRISHSSFPAFCLPRLVYGTDRFHSRKPYKTSERTPGYFENMVNVLTAWHLTPYRISPVPVKRGLGDTPIAKRP